MHRWPLEQLTVHTARLTLKLPDPGELEALATLAAVGVFEPGSQLGFAWHVPEPAGRARHVIQWHHLCIGRWEPDSWNLPLAVLRDGDVVGVQALRANEFGVCRVVTTGSWLGLAHQGQGIGTEMRSAVLTLAKRIGAHHAESDALVENAASSAVTRKLGYQPNGIRVACLHGEPRVLHRYTLDLHTWTPPADVTIDGLEPAALELLGAPT